MSAPGCQGVAIWAGLVVVGVGMVYVGKGSAGIGLVVLLVVVGIPLSIVLYWVMDSSKMEAEKRANEEIKERNQKKWLLEHEFQEKLKAARAIGREELKRKVLHSAAEEFARRYRPDDERQP